MSAGMGEPFQVVVIGGGVNGLAAMAALGRMGVRRRLLLERFRLGHRRGSSHGRTRITRSVYPEPHWLSLMRVAREEDWPRLERDAGLPLIEPCAGCFLGTGPVSFERYARAVEAAAAPGEIERLDPPELRQRFPQFRAEGAVGALHDHTAGLVHAERCVQALARLALAHGGEIREQSRVLHLRRDVDPLRIECEGASFAAERLILAAGPWSAALLPELAPLLRPLRQSVVWYRLAGEPAAFGPARFPVWATLGDGPNDFYYGLPDPGGEGLKLARHRTLGPPDDPERELNPPESELEALDAFARAHFCAPVEARLSAESCYYSVLPDEGFRIDLLPGDPRIAVALACSGHGFKFAPLVGRVLAGLALHGRSEVLAFERAREAFRLPVLDPPSAPLS
jgi:monomeric sarcosine oxidase